MQARKKITQRGAKLGIDFDAEVAKLRAAADWDQEIQVSVTCVSAESLFHFQLDTSIASQCINHACVPVQATQNPALQLPVYYQNSFHAYQQGNLCWEAAWEVLFSYLHCHHV